MKCLHLKTMCWLACFKGDWWENDYVTAAGLNYLRCRPSYIRGKGSKKMMYE